MSVKGYDVKKYWITWKEISLSTLGAFERLTDASEPLETQAYA